MEIIVFSAILGLITGSFINALVLRLHAGESIVFGRSKCANCLLPISPADLIPVASFILLRRKCRNCKSIISWQYPLVEAVSCALFALSAYQHVFGLFGVDTSPIYLLHWHLVRDFAFIFLLVSLFAYDARFRLLPDAFTVPGIITAFAFSAFLSNNLYSALAGSLTAGAFFGIQYAVSKGKWIGGGDVTMGLMIGAMLGFGKTLVALFFAYAIGASLALILIALKKKKMNSVLPFGAFLSAGAIIALFAGDLIAKWYLGML
ncbi:MAG: hypothetical protein ACD_76C00101G0008 [uncultured bacterium]|nr:MAG: hypothetical protein ACD_76C00101G0008 [uncultured bacterium]HBD05681.1 hypothetical protein [Candidatus Uhrbacteria bacterium]